MRPTRVPFGYRFFEPQPNDFPFSANTRGSKSCKTCAAEGLRKHTMNTCAAEVRGSDLLARGKDAEGKNQRVCVFKRLTGERPHYSIAKLLQPIERGCGVL